MRRDGREERVRLDGCHNVLDMGKGGRLPGGWEGSRSDWALQTGKTLGFWESERESGEDRSANRARVGRITRQQCQSFENSHGGWSLGVQWSGNPVIGCGKAINVV